MKRRIFFWPFVTIVILWACNSSGSTDSCKSFGATYSKMLNNGVDTQFLIKKLNNLIRKDLKCIDALLTRGDIYIEMDSLKLAEQDYMSVLRLDVNNIYALYQLSVIASLNSKYDTVFII